MYKSLLVFIFLLLTGSHVFCQAQKSVISWDANRPLTMEDFKVVNDTADIGPHGDNLAVTRTGITYTIKQENKRQIVVQVFATMYPANSFVRQRVLKANPKRQQYLLAHEQLHFDISEVFARVAIAELQQMTVTANYKNEIAAAMKKIFKNATQWQDDYDRDTHNGLNEKQQLNWQKKIYDALKTSAYFGQQGVIKKLITVNKCTNILPCQHLT